MLRAFFSDIVEGVPHNQCQLKVLRSHAFRAMHYGTLVRARRILMLRADYTFSSGPNPCHFPGCLFYLRRPPDDRNQTDRIFCTYVVVSEFLGGSSYHPDLTACNLAARLWVPRQNQRRLNCRLHEAGNSRKHIPDSRLVLVDSKAWVDNQ